MKVLVACEMSGAVRDAFLAGGHDAMSCDIIDSIVPGPHYKGDVLAVLNAGWDLIIAHPPCTAVCVTGNRHYAGTEARVAACEFIQEIWNADCEKLVIENPQGVINSMLPGMPKPQYIHPWMFGDQVAKKTGLWIRGLDHLVPDITEEPELEYVTFSSGKRMSKWYYETSLLPQKDRATARSVTFPGIANAMAEQWGDV